MGQWDTKLAGQQPHMPPLTAGLQKGPKKARPQPLMDSPPTEPLPLLPYTDPWEQMQTKDLTYNKLLQVSACKRSHAPEYMLWCVKCVQASQQHS